MLTKLQLKDLLVANLQHNYMFSFQLFLTRLISRNVYGGGINQYRIKNLITNTYITTLDEFIFSITDTHLSLSYDFFESCGSGLDLPHPFFVILDNFIVELDQNSDEDDIYFSLYGGSNKNIKFIMTYMGDADTVLPLKIMNVKLI